MTTRNNSIQSFIGLSLLPKHAKIAVDAKTFEVVRGRVGGVENQRCMMAMTPSCVKNDNES